MRNIILALLEDIKNSHDVYASLASLDNEVLVVKTFAEAMDVLAHKTIDLIISDVHLENGGSVFDFLMWVKRNPKTKSVPFVLFASRPTVLAKYLEDGIKLASRALGAAKYISMEIFDSKAFREQIDSVLLRKTEHAEAELNKSN